MINLKAMIFMVAVSHLVSATTWAMTKASGPENTYLGPSAADVEPVDDKYRLKADREKFEEIRRQIPQDLQVNNDEEALILQLLGDPSKNPSSVRQAFDRLVKKKRDSFNKDQKKERELFNKTEKNNREQFLKQLKEQRDDFVNTKASKEEAKEFFTEQNTKRAEYFQAEKERRNDFESSVREKRQNFEDYVREKRDEFNNAYKSFLKNHEDWKKNKQQINRPLKRDADLLEQELIESRSLPSSPLEAGQ